MALVSNKIRPIVAVGEELVKTMKASEFNKLLKKMADAVKGGTTADEFYNTHKMLLVEGRSHALNSRFSRFVETVQYAWNRLVHKFKPRDWQFAFGHERLLLHHNVCDDFRLSLDEVTQLNKLPMEHQQKILQSIKEIIPLAKGQEAVQAYQLILDTLRLEMELLFKKNVEKNIEQYVLTRLKKSKFSTQQLENYVRLVRDEVLVAGKQAVKELGKSDDSLSSELHYLQHLAGTELEETVVRTYCYNRLSKIGRAYWYELHKLEKELPKRMVE